MTGVLLRSLDVKLHMPFVIANPQNVPLLLFSQDCSEFLAIIALFHFHFFKGERLLNVEKKNISKALHVKGGLLCGRRTRK